MSSALRKRMIDGMIIRHMSEKTIESYVGAAKMTRIASVR